MGGEVTPNLFPFGKEIKMDIVFEAVRKNPWSLIGLAATAQQEIEDCEAEIDWNPDDEDSKWKLIRASMRLDELRAIYLRILLAEIEDDNRAYQFSLRRRSLSSEREGDMMASDPDRYVGAPSRY